ncbi:hypothetical protein MLD38_002994 [Melastoma candidum]|uniref:Uncharacterized protein n=1 Tax=Melastoma candidum TaxID=119954 RepID=A0ACB9S1E0_9MYRT|nr:hypothetical protein MLD38_002994 [Melastoma candidum]
MAMSVVTRTGSCLIQPSGETPPLAALELSVMDRIPVLRCYARTLHVFRSGGCDASRVIKDALGKALVPYYPLAGRLREPAPGQVVVECTNEGVWFVEASTTHTLESVDYFDDVVTVPYDDLLPEVPSAGWESGEPLVQMQVTEFACGGFVIGLVFCHTICDGLGAAQFLSAVSEFARGLESPTVKPVWSRDFLPPREVLATDLAIPPSLPPIPNYQLQSVNIDILIDRIDLLKQSYNKRTSCQCSTFEAVSALFWKSRTEEITSHDDAKPDSSSLQQTQTLVFFANCRHLMSPPLPEGFYGNCFFPVTITASSESLYKSSLHEVIDMIQEAKGRVATEFEKFAKGEYVDDPFAPPMGYMTLFLSEWGRLGFNEVDYGWGVPVHVIPVQGSAVQPAGILGRLPLPRKGVRLMTWCVAEGHGTRLLKCMKQCEDQCDFL